MAEKCYNDKLMVKVDKYGRGSAAVNGEGFVDLAPGDTFAALEAQLKRRIAEQFDNAVLGISAAIGSKRNASELAKHLASGEEEEVHKFAAKNIGVLFVRGQLGVSHDDKKAVAGQRWITRFIRVFTPFWFAGDGYLATLTLKDVDPDKRIYAVEAVEINQDAKSRSTPRGAMSEDLNSAPFQDLTSQLTKMISYYVGDVNRTHSKFVGRDEMFSIGRTVELLERIVQDSCTRHQAPSTKHQTPKFSIIIPVYNVEPYLRECLDSLLAQTFIDWEAICVDDGSADDSLCILQEYASKDARFRAVHQDNAGVSEARNLGLSLAVGEYIVFLDADDCIESGVLSCLAADSPEMDLVIFGAGCFKGDRARMQDFFLWRESITLSGDELLMGGQHAQTAPATWTVWGKRFVRKRLLELGLEFAPGIRLGEDMLFAVEYISTCKKILIDSRCPQYMYRRDSGVTSKSFSLDMMQRQLDRVEKMVRFERLHPSGGLRRHLTEEIKSLLRIGRTSRFQEEYVDYLLEDKRLGCYMRDYRRDTADSRWHCFFLCYNFCPRGIRRWLINHI